MIRKIRFVPTLVVLALLAAASTVLYAQSNGIYSSSAGTITTSAPLSGAQTWNAGGVSFIGMKLTFTETASAAGSQYLQILGGAAGTTQMLAVNKDGALALGKTTSQLILGVTNTTTLTAPAPAASTVLTLPNIGPSNAASVPTMFNCGSTGSGNQTCTPAAVSGIYHIISGRSTLAASAAVITFPAGTTFTSNATYECVATDVTTRANPVQMVPTNASSATITNTTGATDVITWMCAGT